MTEAGRARGGSEAGSASPPPGSGRMFDAIVERYDLLNRVLSLGMDQRWRRLTVRALALPERATVLDLATGTGDLALAISRRHPDARVIGLDPSRGMLARAEEKIAEAGAGIVFSRGDAHDLPFPDSCFDGVSVAFGARNFPDRARALREMRRVTRPGGRVAILELSPPGAGRLGGLTKLWVESAVPWIGARLSRGAAYRYLEESVSAFPTPEVFSSEVTKAGLQPVGTRSLSLGACCLFAAERPLRD